MRKLWTSIDQLPILHLVHQLSASELLKAHAVLSCAASSLDAPDSVCETDLPDSLQSAHGSLCAAIASRVDFPPYSRGVLVVRCNRPPPQRFFCGREHFRARGHNCLETSLPDRPTNISGALQIVLKNPLPDPPANISVALQIAFKLLFQTLLRTFRTRSKLPVNSSSRPSCEHLGARSKLPF